MHTADKVATLIFWIAAGISLILFTVDRLRYGVGSADRWSLAAVALAWVVLAFGARQCFQSIRQKPANLKSDPHRAN